MSDQTTPTADVDIEENRAWLKSYRANTGLSWKELAKRTGVAYGTLSQFGSDKGYSGNETPLAEAIARYRQLIATQSVMDIDAPIEPGYFDTQTSEELMTLFSWCQRGEMGYAALSSGLGKSTAAYEFKARYPNVTIATMSPSCASLHSMLVTILEEMGEANASGTPKKLSLMIRERFARQRNPLLILDEAQEMTVKAIEEVRSWHDVLEKRGLPLGIVFLGDKRLAQLIQNGTGKNDLPQLRRRMMPLVRLKSYSSDITALAAAWNVVADNAVAELHRIAEIGGIGLGSKCLKLGTIFAAARKEALGVDHLQEAVQQLAPRGVAA